MDIAKLFLIQTAEDASVTYINIAVGKNGL